MRSLPRGVERRTIISHGNCYSGSCHNWLCCLLGGLGQSGLPCGGFNSPRREVRCGWLNQQLIMSLRCPLYPRKRTCAVQLRMSAKCQ